MNVEMARQILSENHVKDDAFPICPPRVVEGALALVKEGQGGWRIRHNERGAFLRDEYYASEDAACRRFVCLVLSDPTSRKDFAQLDLAGFRNRLSDLLGKYGLEC
jgi:hypothetical protein